MYVCVYIYIWTIISWTTYTPTSVQVTASRGCELSSQPRWCNLRWTRWQREWSHQSNDHDIVLGYLWPALKLNWPICGARAIFLVASLQIGFPQMWEVRLTRISHPSRISAVGWAGDRCAGSCQAGFVKANLGMVKVALYNHMRFAWKHLIAMGPFPIRCQGWMGWREWCAARRCVAGNRQPDSF